jgi:hypothetical protein
MKSMSSREYGRIVITYNGSYAFIKTRNGARYYFAHDIRKCPLPDICFCNP